MIKSDVIANHEEDMSYVYCACTVFSMLKLTENKSFIVNPEFIRNICFMAHVDHGKTTIVDHLIASNRIITESMAGKFKYMDSRDDEQKHGITMKSSSIYLEYKYKKTKDYVINVIDSPGHADFSSEVSCAVRLCDGTPILIDVIEGVCPQTEMVLRQTCVEGIRPCLVLNKIDRLLRETMMSPLDAYYHFLHIVEEANSILACIFKELSLENEIEISSDLTYFNPTEGNVLFCSGYYGWGFRISDFFNVFKEKLKITDKSFLKGLWGDYYYDFKAKKVFPIPIGVKKKPMFVQFILENLWTVYSAFLGSNANTQDQKNVVTKIAPNLMSKISNYIKSEEKYNFLMKKWLPLVHPLMEMIIELLPSPLHMSKRRIKSLLSTSMVKFKDLPKATKNLQKHFFCCSNSKEAPIIIFISKMIHYDQKDIEIANASRNTETVGTFVALARIFSGTVRSGCSLYVLTPKYVPGYRDSEKYYQQITVKDLYMFMGKELIPVTEVPAGNIFGMGSLSNHLIKSGTLSSTLDCPSFSPINFEVKPLMNVSIEPENLADYSKLVDSLDLLNLSDPILNISQSPTGEHILSVIGEVHLMKCIDDLKHIAGEISLHISDPIVPFRESVSETYLNHKNFPTYLNDIINGSDANISFENSTLKISTLDENLSLKIRVEHMSSGLENFLENNNQFITMLPDQISNSSFSKILLELKLLLDSQSHLNIRRSAHQSVLCFSNILCTNILIDNCLNSFNYSLLSSSDTDKPIGNLFSSLCTGMQLACLAGPLMGETVSGVFFILDEIVFNSSQELNVSTEQVYDLSTSGQVVSSMKQGCLTCLVLSNRLRVSLPMFKCVIRTNVKTLKAVYSVLSRRWGKVLQESQIEDTTVFVVEALLPAQEMFGLSLDMRKQTSGFAQTQLTFSHWEIIPTDPFYEEENDSTYIKNIVSAKTIKGYIESTRKRKGLTIDEKLIQDSEKQRTIKKNK